VQKQFFLRNLKFSSCQIFTNFEISFHEISLNARHSYNEHVEQETLLIQLWAILVWAVLVIALGRFVPALGRFGHVKNLWPVFVWAILV